MILYNASPAPVILFLPPHQPAVPVRAGQETRPLARSLVIPAREAVFVSPEDGAWLQRAGRLASDALFMLKPEDEERHRVLFARKPPPGVLVDRGGHLASIALGYNAEYERRQHRPTPPTRWWYFRCWARKQRFKFEGFWFRRRWSPEWHERVTQRMTALLED